MINNFFNKHSKSITAGITIILIIAFFIYLKPLLNLMSINSESLFAPYMSKIESIDNDSFLQIFTSNNHSWFLFSIAYVIISRYLPIWLNMHPQMCIAYVGSYILFILLTCLILSLAKSCTKYIKNKNIFPLIFLFGIMSFFQC